MMLYTLLVLLALTLTAYGSRKHVQISVAMKYAEKDGALRQLACCDGNYTLKLIMQKGLSEWISLELQILKEENNQHEVLHGKYQVPLTRGNKKFGLLKGFVVRYFEDPEEEYITDHKYYGFQKIMEMKVWLTDGHYGRNKRPACAFTDKTTYGEDKYTVVCHLKPKPRWMNRVKKEFPQATYFERVDLPDLGASTAKAGPMSIGGYDKGIWDGGSHGMSMSGGGGGGYDGRSHGGGWRNGPRMEGSKMSGGSGKKAVPVW